MAIVTLTTDFGHRDGYVGAMKGMILSRAPQATLVDITHDIEPFNIRSAAFVLAQVFRTYPKKTIHLCVVDPGVGGERRAIMMEADGHYFVGPDNGVFSFVQEMCKQISVRHLTNTKYFAKNISATFHGRDVFAPVAACLASKIKPAQLGKIIHDQVSLGFKEVLTTKTRMMGQVLHIDHYGNVVTSLRALLAEAWLREGRFALQLAGNTVRRYHQTFAHAEAGEAFAYLGSAGFVEIAMNKKSLAGAWDVAVGDDIILKQE